MKMEINENTPTGWRKRTLSVAERDDAAARGDERAKKEIAKEKIAAATTLAEIKSALMEFF